MVMVDHEKPTAWSYHDRHQYGAKPRAYILAPQHLVEVVALSAHRPHTDRDLSRMEFANFGETWLYMYAHVVLRKW